MTKKQTDMAKLLEGILGGFSGKVGQVVGIQWKGRSCMRSYVARISDRRSPLQLEQRSRFTAMIRMAQQSMYAIRLGFKQKADEHRVTEGNWFSHRNTGAFRVVDGAVVVDYERIAVAEGTLAGVTFHVPEFDAEDRLRVAFDDDRNLAGTSRRDSVYVYAYCPALGQGLLLPPAERQSEVIECSLPITWHGSDIHLYGFTVGKKGGVSHSMYLGSGTVGKPSRLVELPIPQPAEAPQAMQPSANQQLTLWDTLFESAVAVDEQQTGQPPGDQLSVF